MPIIAEDVTYMTVSDVAGIVGVARQTVWRWHRQGLIPAGHKFRNRTVVFAPDEVEAIREYANRVEPVEGPQPRQLSLLNGSNNQRSDRHES